MKIRTALFSVLALTVVGALAASPAPDPAHAGKRSTHKASARKPVAHTTTGAHATTRTATQVSSSTHKPTTHTINMRKKPASVRPAPVTWRTRQTAPTTDRYREIQQALASKGYLPADQATGQWNDASAEALRRFQTDQNIQVSGKINSLSLIALGLGPKRDNGDASKTEIGLPKPENQGPGDGRQ